MIDNALVYHILLKIFMGMDAYEHAKQRKRMKHGWALLFNVHKWFFSIDDVARQATEAEKRCSAPIWVRKNDGIRTRVSHSIKNSRLQWHRLRQLSPPLSPRNQEYWVGKNGQCWQGPTKAEWQGFWCYSVLPWSDGHKKCYNMQSFHIAMTRSQ